MTDTQTLTGGQAIVQALLAHGVDTVFGLPGAQLYGLFDALAEESAHIQTIGARHEQTCAYMAYGYAKSTGKPGVYAVVPGPGVLNTTAALCTAMGACAPVLGLTGEVPSSYLGAGRGHLHELRDQRATLELLVKHAAHVPGAAAAPKLVAQAFQTMLSGRPGPATVEMCWDKFVAREETAACAPLPLLAPPALDQDMIAKAAKLLAQARAPMIFVGSGALHASAEVQELAERTGAPVVPFRSGRGIVPDSHALGLTCASGYPLWAETDVALAIGTRLELPMLRWGSWFNRELAMPQGKTLIRIDIDAQEHSRLHADVPITADAREAAAALNIALGRLSLSSRRSAEAIADAKAKTAQAIQQVQPQMAYVEALRGVMPADSFLVEEVSQMGFTAEFGYPVSRPREFVTCGFQGTLGFGFPTALGVKAAHPDKAVVSITGDGGFMFAAAELATAMQYGINLVTVLFNNQRFQNVKRDQVRLYQGRTLGADLRNPDFVKMAEAFGMAGTRVNRPEAMAQAVSKALESGAPALIEVVVPPDSDSSPWPFLMPKGL